MEYKNEDGMISRGGLFVKEHYYNNLNSSCHMHMPVMTKDMEYKNEDGMIFIR